LSVVINGFLFQRVDPSEEQMMETIYRLRFDVYARQCRFIREEDYPLELESDEYDAHSSHFVAIHDDVVIATARMILTDEKSSPFLKYFPHVPIQHNFLPGFVTEISRLIISKKLRNSRNFSNRLTQFHQPSGLSCYATIVCGLCLEIYKEIKRRGITHWCALMEKSLSGLLRIYGFRMQCVGHDVNVFGLVRPYIGNVAEMEGVLYKPSYFSASTC